MLKAKIAVLVSGGGTNLQALIDAQAVGIIKSGELALVISSSPSAFALKRAEKDNIKTAVVDKKSCTSAEDFENKINAALSENGIELVVLAGFMSILSAEFVAKWPKRI
ncbi:MAG: formyltransferase family protein, partial [Oscillospiraceae bacterium]